MRIATGGITHETSTFINTKTSMKEFEAGGGVFRGSQVLEQFRGTNNEEQKAQPVWLFATRTSLLASLVSRDLTSAVLKRCSTS